MTQAMTLETTRPKGVDGPVGLGPLDLLSRFILVKTGQV